MSGHPQGQRFSHLYLKQDTVIKDSDRLRKRIASFYSQKTSLDSYYHLKTLIESELGISAPHVGYANIMTAFFSSCELRDFLDIITLVYRHLYKSGAPSRAYEWVQFINRVFREENAAYILDSQAGVHFFQDHEFQKNKAATLSHLGNQRYNAVRSLFEAAYNALDEQPPNTRLAIRDMFEAIETMSKLLDEKISRLGSTEIEKNLKPLCLSQFAEGSIEKNLASKMLNSMKEWADGHQAYRHGQKNEEPNPPPLNLTIMSMGMGASFLRFLLEIDYKQNS